MYFNDLVGKYSGARVAVLGSGPTLNDYKNSIGDCDVVIACNGSLRAMDPNKDRVDYFIYGDRISPDNIWFRDSLKFSGIEGKCVRLSPTFLLHKDPCVENDLYLREKIMGEFEDFIGRQQRPNDTEVNFRPSVEAWSYFKDREDIVPYLLANFKPHFVNRNLAPLCRGPTITGTATMLAHKMGADVIELYGCGFNNTSGRNYAYSAPKGDLGKTSSAQRAKMNRILKIISGEGVLVFSRGETALDHLEVID